MSTVPKFLNLCERHGSNVLFHRDQSASPCPCLTPEGFRDPIWHLQHPGSPECNEAGMLIDTDQTTEITVKAFVQPVQSSAVRRLTAEVLVGMFGEIESDDHVGIFPVNWHGTELNFYEWGESGEDWLKYNERNYQVVSTNLIPDPADGNPRHHWEVGLRLVSEKQTHFTVGDMISSVDSGVRT